MSSPVYTTHTCIKMPDYVNECNPLLSTYLPKYYLSIVESEKSVMNAINFDIYAVFSSFTYGKMTL